MQLGRDCPCTLASEFKSIKGYLKETNHKWQEPNLISLDVALSLSKSQKELLSTAVFCGLNTVIVYTCVCMSHFPCLTPLLSEEKGVIYSKAVSSSNYFRYIGSKNRITVSLSVLFIYCFIKMQYI